LISLAARFFLDEQRAVFAVNVTSPNTARAILGGIEMIHMMRKGQAKCAQYPQPSLAEPFDLLAA
jgi:transposase-like protein